MLINFSVENYRCFAERQTFSLTAGVAAGRDSRISVASEIPQMPSLLRSATLFGANGAGKSNLVDAMRFFRNFILYSSRAGREDQTMPLTQFCEMAQQTNGTSRFEAVFIHEAMIYHYGFALDDKRIRAEWLRAKPNMEQCNLRTLFSRSYDPETREYHWEINRKQLPERRTRWSEATSETTLFLSTAVRLRAEALLPPYLWIRNQFRPILAEDRWDTRLTARKCQSPSMAQRVIEVLRRAGVAVDDIRVNPGAGLRVNLIRQARPGRSVAIDLSEESRGVQALFALIGIWLDALDRGYTLVVDDLNGNLHPLTMRFLVEMFHDPEINQNNAQLIFTGHETLFLSQEMLYPEQIWFVDPPARTGARLFSLSRIPFHQRRADYRKSYLEGRFSGIPKVAPTA